MHRILAQELRKTEWVFMMNEGEVKEMPVPMCFICVYNDPKHPENQAVSYTDCDYCQKPTCKKHGRDHQSERFLCIRCLYVLQLAS